MRGVIVAPADGTIGPDLEYAAENVRGYRAWDYLQAEFELFDLLPREM